MRVGRAVAVFGVVITVASGAWAQSATQKPQGQQSGQMMMSMDDMMKGCRDHCTKASTSMDGTMKMMNDARQSSDAAKMRMTIDQAQKQMTEVREHMSMCMNMMGMMQNMGGDAKKK